MSILIFDTETTGLIAGQICQLSYIIEDAGDICAKNYYFSVDAMDEGASRVNGFTPEILRELSKGRVFNDDIEEIANDFVNASLIISHNFSFDYTFLNAEFKRAGKQFLYRDEFCTMRKFTPVCALKRVSSGGYKYPKLSELMAHFGVGLSDALMFASMVFGEDGRSLAFHDARFDTAGLYLAVKNGGYHFPKLTAAMGA